MSLHVTGPRMGSWAGKDSREACDETSRTLGAFPGQDLPPPRVPLTSCCRRTSASQALPEFQKSNLIKGGRKCRNKGKQPNKTK